MSTKKRPTIKADKRPKSAGGRMEVLTPENSCPANTVSRPTSQQSSWDSQHYDNKSESGSSFSSAATGLFLTSLPRKKLRSISNFSSPQEKERSEHEDMSFGESEVITNEEVLIDERYSVDDDFEDLPNLAENSMAVASETMSVNDTSSCSSEQPSTVDSLQVFAPGEFVCLDCGRSSGCSCNSMVSGSNSQPLSNTNVTEEILDEDQGSESLENEIVSSYNSESEDSEDIRESEEREENRRLGPVERFCSLLSEEQERRVEELLNDPLYDRESEKVPLGVGFAPTKEEFDRLADIERQLMEYLPYEKRSSETCVSSNTHGDESNFSWKSEELSLDTPKHGKYKDYLLEMRQEKERRTRMQEIEQQMQTIHERNLARELEPREKILELLMSLRATDEANSPNAE